MIWRDPLTLQGTTQQRWVRLEHKFCLSTVTIHFSEWRKGFGYFIQFHKLLLLNLSRLVEQRWNSAQVPFNMLTYSEGKISSFMNRFMNGITSLLKNYNFLGYKVPVDKCPSWEGIKIRHSSDLHQQNHLKNHRIVFISFVLRMATERKIDISTPFICVDLNLLIKR